MSLGNNHSYDYAKEGFDSTKEELEEVGIATVGDPQKQASSSVEFLSLDGVTVSLIGLYAVDVAPTSNEIQLLLEATQKESDLQVVYVHWGTEYKTIHNKSQERLAHQLIDAGADVIIGHHPHVVQDIEIYQNKLIFYSLGNFIFDQYFSDEVQEGLMVELDYRDGNYEFSLLPVTSIGSRSAPRIMNDFERDEFLQLLSKNSDISLATMIQAGTITVPKQ
jgi:poly-gamma-glutamate synthesis protein (capsule biosynthesis protein)